VSASMPLHLKDDDVMKKKKEKRIGKSQRIK
jgi:hypothetical protein